MKFKFNVWEKIKEVWSIYKQNLRTLLVMAIITYVVGLVGFKDNWFISILFYLVSILIFYVWVQLSFALIEKRKFNPFSKEALPTLKQYWNLLKTVILQVLILLGGFLLFIIPGIYFSGRLMFAPYISIEKNQGARKSIKESWDMTKGNGWRIFWKSFLIGLFMVAGILVFFVGALITYPISYIVLVILYREFLKFKNGSPSDVKNENDSKVETVKDIPTDTVKEEVKEI